MTVMEQKLFFSSFSNTWSIKTPIRGLRKCFLQMENLISPWKAEKKILENYPSKYMEKESQDEEK